MHRGERYNIELGDALMLTEYKFKVPVRIVDTQTGEEITRMGKGEFIGNFSPIWVTIGGKEYLVEKILDIKYDL